MIGRDWRWPLAILGSVAAVGAVTLLAPGNPIRLAVALWFFFVCPGMALVRLLGVNDHVTEWTLAVALSIALDAIVAGALLYAGMWSPTASLIALIGISVIGAAFQIGGALRSRRLGRRSAMSAADAAEPGFSRSRTIG
jgi:hypothetical protein